jgi:ABC-type nitrate/sulfonate/bicarbonate transport system substrate-binding protein
MWSNLCRYLNVLAATLAVACMLQSGTVVGADTVSGAKSTKLVPLHIVLNRNTSNLIGFLADDQHLFEKYGLDVKITVASNGSESNELLAAGRADGGTLGLGTLVIAWANGQKLVPLAKYRDGAAVYSIIARKGAGISKIEDIKGKKAAVTKGTDPETGFILALKAHGVAYSDVNVINAKWADMAALLDRGEIDVANANEPFGTKMLNTMSDKVVLIERLTPYYGDGGVIALSAAALAKYPKAGEALALAYWEGHKIVRDQPEKAVASLEKWLKLDKATAEESLKTFGAQPLMSDVTVKDLETNADIMLANNKIRSKPDIAALMKPAFAIQEELLKNPAAKALLPAP